MKEKTPQHIKHERLMASSAAMVVQYMDGAIINAAQGTLHSAATVRMAMQHMTEFFRAAEWCEHHQARRLEKP